MNTFLAIKRSVIQVFLFCFIFLPPLAKSESVEQNSAGLLDFSLEDLLNLDMEIGVVSKKLESINDAPGVVDVIDVNEIRRFGAKNLLDVLNRSTSVQVYSSSFAPNAIVSMRGQTFQHKSNHLLFLINGRPIRDSLAGAFSPSLFLSFPINLIQRIEIIRGPGSVLYGTNAFSGVINIVTKRAEDVANNAELSLSAGSFGSSLVRGESYFDSPDWDIVAGVKAFNSDGWLYKTTDRDDIYGEFDREEKDLGAFVSVSYNDFSLNTFIGNSDQASLGANVRFPTHPFKSEVRIIDLGYQFEPYDGWTLQSNLTHNYLRRNGSSSGDPDLSFSDFLTEFNVSGQISKKAGLLFGAVYEKHTGILDDEDVDALWLSSFSQIDYRANDDLKFIAGIQMNRPEGFEVDVSPRVAVIYGLTSELNVKFLYGEAFRSPYFSETSRQASSLVGNPDLQPESIKSFDLQLQYQGQYSSASINIFHSTLTDLIGRVGSSPATFFNGSELTSQGVEFEGKIILNDNWYMLGSSTYQENKVETGERNTVPEFMAKIGLSYSSPDKTFNASIFDSYFATPTLTSEVFDSVSVVNPVSKSYHLITANVSYALSAFGFDDATVSIYIDNLLDQDINFPDINKRLVNSLPIHSGIGVYATVTTKF